MSAIEGAVAYQGWSLRGVPLYRVMHININKHVFISVLVLK